MKDHNMRLKKKTGIIFFAFFFFAAACPVRAATYYVKADGNDNLDGLSDRNAWATIIKVQATVKSGDVVYFRSQDTWAGINPVLVPVAGVTYDGSNYGNGTRATLRATSRASSNGLVQIRVSDLIFRGFKVDANKLSMSGVAIGYTYPMPKSDISNITVHNCEITNGIKEDNPDPAFYYALHVSMSGWAAQTASNITITDNIVHDAGHEGIAIYPQTSSASRVNNVLVRGNTICNTGQAGGNRQNPIDIVNDSDNVIVEFNSVYNCPSGISMTCYGPIQYNAPSPNGVVIRYNLLNDAGGIGINGYFGQEGIDGYGEISNNIVIFGGLGLTAQNWHNGVWKIYNNIFLSDYSAGKGSYVLDGGLYKTAMNARNVEIKNNIFMGTGLHLVRDQANALGSTGGIIHSNNLFYRTDSSSEVVQTSVLSDANAVQSTSVSITHDSKYTYFTKSGGSDWTRIFSVNDYVKWIGFSNDVFKDRLFIALAVTADQIKTYNVYLGSDGPIETKLVTGEKWGTRFLSSADLKQEWEPTAQITDPSFVGGTLPSGFTGTFGIDMVPNTHYFAIQSGNALNNGAILGSPYDGCINGAGLATPVIRPKNAYDIGAYQSYTEQLSAPKNLRVK